MSYTPDGAPIPDGIPKRALESGPGMHNSSFALRRGYVQRAVYKGEPDNQTGFLEYVVVIEGQEFFGVLDMTQGGGIFNTHTRIRRGAENIDIPNVQGYDERKDGEQVFCLFIRGDGDLPIIVGSDTHVRVNENSNWIEPSKSLGLYERYEFNGLEFLIDKDGNFTITHLGNTIVPAVGPPIPDPSTLPFKGGFYKIHKDGKIEIDLKPSTTIIVDPVSNTMELKNGAGTTFTIDGATDKITMLAAFGDSFHVAGPDGIQGTTPSGTSLSFNAGFVEFEGTGGKLKLGAGQVGIGSGAVELLSEISDTLDKLATYMQGEATAASTYVSTAVGPGVLNPSRVTDAAGLVIDLNLIKAKVDSIKGGV